MIRQCLGRFTWLARIVVLGGILLLAARADVLMRRDGDSSVSRRLTTLVNCVQPATADDPASTPASVPEAMRPDCGPSMPDRLATAWMTC